MAALAKEMTVSAVTVEALQVELVVMVHVPFHGGRREMEREVNVMMEST